MDTPALEGEGHSHRPRLRQPTLRAIARAARWLIDAENPLILVAYAGRNPEAVAALVRLAETLAAPVVESRQRVNFPFESSASSRILACSRVAASRLRIDCRSRRSLGPGARQAKAECEDYPD